jgi:UPF0755 protein
MSQLGLGMRTETQEPRPRRRRGRGGLAVLVAALVILVLVAGAMTAAVRWFTNKPDYSGAGHGEVSVQVKAGDSTGQIAATLERQDVVASAQAFVTVVGSDGTPIQPGTYRLHLQMGAQDAYDLLLDPASRVSSRVLITEGLRTDQVLALLARSTQIPINQLDAALNDPQSLALPDYSGGNPEGFLFPATYDLTPGMTAPALLAQMVKRFGQAARDTDLVERASEMHMTPYQVLIVASIVQAEGRTQDFPKIARAILNRLGKHMKLQLDSTVHFILKDNQKKLTSADIAVRSPYNTYLVDGLPPGPIDSPGEDAINAVLSPAAGNWLYWVTVDPKTQLTKFTASYAEFLTFKAELKANGG